MTTLNVSEVLNRGYASGLASLAPQERDVFVIADLDIYCDMEGGFADHMVTSPEIFDWLLSTLQRIGNINSHSIITRLRRTLNAPMEQTSPLRNQYDAGRQFRLKCLERYLGAEGFELDWN